MEPSRAVTQTTKHINVKEYVSVIINLLIYFIVPEVLSHYSCEHHRQSS